MQKILDLCLKEGARLAQPGEFTKRAFLNGRIDLVQAETVLDLIRAKTERSYQVAQSHLEGHLSAVIKRHRDTLAYLLSHMEASLDFPDDQLSPMEGDQLLERSKKIRQEINALIASSQAGQWIKEGLKVVITGKPNVGKSSLLNVLAGRDRVLVSDHPGTTRDTIEESVEIDGCAVRLFDTAGIRITGEPLESESVRRSKKIVQEADLILFVVDASLPVREDERQYWDSLENRPKILVLNKLDLLKDPAAPHALAELNGNPAIHTSCRHFRGIDAIKHEISSFIFKHSPGPSDEFWVYSVRQLDLFRKASHHLTNAIGAFENRMSSEFPAADLRLAMDALGEIVGEVVTDDILDLVFSQFCIGK